MLMLLGQRFEESLICFWLVIQVAVLFFVTFYFYFEIYDTLHSLFLSCSTHTSVCARVCMYFYTPSAYGDVDRMNKRDPYNLLKIA